MSKRTFCAAQTPPDNNRIQAAHLPTPFSATQIREGCSAGALRVFEIMEGGLFDCWVYRTTAKDGSWSESSFALTIPGPPVLSVQDQADGTEISRMELMRFKL